MVEHIVFWDINEDIPLEEHDTVKNTMKQILESLVGVIPGLISAKVITDSMQYGNVDVALFTELEDEAALLIYKDHPAHVEAGKYVRSHVGNRRCLDFEK